MATEASEEHGTMSKLEEDRFAAHVERINEGNRSAVLRSLLLLPPPLLRSALIGHIDGTSSLRRGRRGVRQLDTADMAPGRRSPRQYCMKRELVRACFATRGSAGW